MKHVAMAALALCLPGCSGSETRERAVDVIDQPTATWQVDQSPDSLVVGLVPFFSVARRIILRPNEGDLIGSVADVARSGDTLWIADVPAAGHSTCGPRQ